MKVKLAFVVRLLDLGPLPILLGETGTFTRDTRTSASSIVYCSTRAPGSVLDAPRS